MGERRTASLRLAHLRPSTSCWLMMMSKDVDARHEAGQDRPLGATNSLCSRYLLPRLRPARRAVAHQAIEVHPDVGGFRGRVGERDGAGERHAGLVVAAKLHQER